MKRVVATGTFDLLHPGHSFFLTEAKKLGDRLTVIVSRDVTVLNVKGRMPIHDERERLEGVRRLGIADDASLGNLGDKLQTIVDLAPDIIALGYDQQAFTEELEARLRSRGLKNVQVIRLPAYLPNQYKSSILRRGLRRRLAKDGES